MSELSGLPYSSATKVPDGTYEQDARTNATDARYQDQGSNRLVPDALTPVDNPEKVASKCRYCGAPGKLRCACGATCCPKHAWYYVDDSNIAINKNARPQCSNCYPPKFPRPYTFARAVERGEVFEVSGSSGVAS